MKVLHLALIVLFVCFNFYSCKTEIAATDELVGSGDSNSQDDNSNATEEEEVDVLSWNDLEFYLSFDSGDTNTQSESIGNRSFNLNQVSLVTGVRGQAASFNGIDSYAVHDIPDANDLVDVLNFRGEEFSVSFWFKTSNKDIDIASTGQVEMIAKSGSIFNWGFERLFDSNWQTWMRFYARASAAIGGAGDFANNSKEVEYRLDSGGGNPDIRDGQWHHIIITHKIYIPAYGTDAAGQSLNSAEERYYCLHIDGVTQDCELSNLQDIKYSTASPKFIIGARYNNGGSIYERFYNGEIDELFIFSRVLTNEEITSLHNRDK